MAVMHGTARVHAPGYNKERERQLRRILPRPETRPDPDWANRLMFDMAAMSGGGTAPLRNAVHRGVADDGPLALGLVPPDFGKAVN